MPDRTALYIEASRQLHLAATRCDGFVADLGQRHNALRRWQHGVEACDPAIIEAALTEFLAGDPPRWTAVRSAFDQWLAVSHEVAACWAALSQDERLGLTPPPVPIREIE